MNVAAADVQRMGREDPCRFVRWLWPRVELYDRQRQILESLRDSKETYVVAGNMLGKDYTAGLAVITFFLFRPKANEYFSPRETTNNAQGV